MLVGKIDQSGIMYKVGTVVLIRWSLTLEEADRGLKKKSDIVSSALEI